MRAAPCVAVFAAAVSSVVFAQQGYVDRMAHEHHGDTPVATAQTAAEPARPVIAAVVTYATVSGAPVQGYLATPAGGQGPWPGLIVIHEWWGLNDNIRAMTRRLAGEGYAALAVDLYGGKVVDTAEQARAAVQTSMESRAANDENLRQAYGYLAEQRRAPKVGVIGWCFGGAHSLAAALLLPEQLDACVVYYGHLETDRTRLRTLGMPILGIFGAEDQGIPVAQVREFEAALKELGKSVEVHVYEGAGHAFANPSGTRYRPEAAADAWATTLAFLARHLK